MKAAVIVFPGSNCDKDCQRAFHAVTGILPDLVWHKETSLEGYDTVFLPGGFSYGDYLRTGAIARFSAIMPEVVKLAERGGLVVGICNGFQVLTEAGLLPGALLRNRDLHFICKDTYLKVENNQTTFTSEYAKDQIIRLPIAHGEGNYFIDDEGYKRLEAQGQVVLRYCDEKGSVSKEACPNGSLGNIAGIVNEKGNVFGLMPHPERLSEQILGGADGAKVFESMIRGGLSI